MLCSSRLFMRQHGARQMESRPVVFHSIPVTRTEDPPINIKEKPLITLESDGHGTITRDSIRQLYETYSSIFDHPLSFSAVLAVLHYTLPSCSCHIVSYFLI